MNDHPPSRRLRLLLGALLIAVGLGYGAGLTSEARSAAEQKSAAVHALGARLTHSRTAPGPGTGPALSAPPAWRALPTREVRTVRPSLVRTTAPRSVPTTGPHPRGPPPGSPSPA